MNLKDILFGNVSQVSPPAFGLDVSDLSLKMAFLKKHRREIRLESFGRKEIPLGIIKEGKIQKKDELIKVVKQAVKGVKLKAKYVVCSLPELHAFVQVIQLPKMKLAEANEAVKWEAEANIPMTADEVYLDWQIVKPLTDNLDHLDVLINAVPRTVVNDYVEVLEGAGLRPIALEVESIATARSLIKREISRKPILIVDLGANRTSFIIFSGYAVRFTTSISVSNRQMIDTIAKGLGITKEKAWKLKVDVGLGGGKRNKDNKVLNILFPTLNILVKEVEKYIGFHREHAAPHEHGSSGEISKIILCGGGANLRGFPQFLSERLKIPVVCGNPWVNILKPPVKAIPELSYKESLTYATALGLALRDINYHK